jgi:hypothetical protein
MLAARVQLQGWAENLSNDSSALLCVLLLSGLIDSI